jgi:hypothetical protein
MHYIVRGVDDTDTSPFINRTSFFRDQETLALISVSLVLNRTSLLCVTTIISSWVCVDDGRCDDYFTTFFYRLVENKKL